MDQGLLNQQQCYQLTKQAELTAGINNDQSVLRCQAMFAELVTLMQAGIVKLSRLVIQSRKRLMNSSSDS
jgi:hypothetical protein